jgi:beta-phosphoglucomutase
LDGVIVDTAYYHYKAWKRLANELGFDLTSQQNERLKGVSRMDSLNILLEIGSLVVNDAEKEKLAHQKNIWFNDFIERMLPEEIFPGVRQLIEKLKLKGVKVALASSSKNARTVIRRLQIENMFEVVVDGTMIIHTKPNPEIFLRTAQLIEILPDNCLVFEDAEAGVEAALAAGMKCVAVGSIQQLGKANMVIDKTGDFRTEMLIGF